MKAKTAVWTSANGETSTIREMELSHLQNLASYLNRREEEYSNLRVLAENKGYALPPPMTQGYTLGEWLTCILGELNRRQLKLEHAAQKTLNPPSFSRNPTGELL